MPDNGHEHERKNGNEKPVPMIRRAAFGSPDSSAALTAAGSAYLELAKIALAEPLGTVLSRVARLAQEIVPGVDDASITLIRAGQASTVAFAGNFAVVLDERQYEDRFGPCTDAAATGNTVVIEDTAQGGFYTGFCREARCAGIRRVLSVGMTTVHDAAGALNLYGAGQIGPFGQDARDIAATFAGYASVAVLNAATHAGAPVQVEQMKQAMASRAGIEQAKGILMGQRHCTAEEAFAVLATLSSQSGRTLRDVAFAVVHQASEQR